MKYKSFNIRKFSVSKLLLFSILFFTASSCDKKEVEEDLSKILPQVRTIQLTEVTNRLAVSGGEVIYPGTLPITSKGVCWHTSPNPTIENSKTINGQGEESFISNVTNLQANTKYYLRAYATNSKGTSYGDELVFTTFFGVVTDVENNSYGTVKIGNQEWMAQDLRTTMYRNSNPIETNLSNVDWQVTFSGAYAVYPHENVIGIDSREQMLSYYGVLYNGYAVFDQRGLCPAGWRVPTDNDWSELVNYITQNNPEFSVSNVGNALKSCRQVGSPLGQSCATSNHPRWSASENHFGSNIYNFSALPSGTRQTSGNYSFLGNYGFYWTSTPGISGFAFRRQLFVDNGLFESASLNMRSGFSVRCVRVVN